MTTYGMPRRGARSMSAPGSSMSNSQAINRYRTASAMPTPAAPSNADTIARYDSAIAAMGMRRRSTGK